MTTFMTYFIVAMIVLLAVAVFLAMRARHPRGIPKGMVPTWIDPDEGKTTMHLVR